MIRVLIVDDHAIVRAGVRQILEGQADIQVIGEAENGQNALDFVRKHPLDLVLLDVSMPGISSLDVVKEIKDLKPQVNVLILSMYAEDVYALRFLRGGASGYITKKRPQDELVQAIRKVASGGKYIDSSFAEKYLFGQTDADMPPHEKLSDREYQVFCMIASGKPVSEIGHELCLSVKTISTHRARIMEKMRMTNNAELMHYAFKHKLVE